jgi:hypothetical protein
MAASDFLSFLVDETFKLQQSGEVELSSLELKLTDYQLAFFKGEFIPQSQVLRFVTPFGDLDFPINWSVFATDGALSSDIILSRENDTDHLLDVMRFAWKLPLNKILVTHADGFCYIVGLKAGEEVYVHDLLNPQEWLKTA